MHDGGVVLAAEARTDALQADGRTFAHEEHGDLPCLGDFLGAAAGFRELGLGNFVVLRYRVEDCIQTNAAAERGRDFRDDLLGDAHVDVVVHQARLQRELDDGAFEAADVARDLFGEEVQHFVADFEVAFFGLLVKDGFARLDVRRLDVDGEAPCETAHEAVGKVLDLDCRCVGRKDDLLARLVQGVEDEEELVLRFVLAGPVLDVVDEQDVHFVAVEVAHLGDAAFAEALEVLLREVFAGEVADALVRVFFENVVADGLQEVRLAEARRTVDEQRVVLRTVRVPGDGEGGVERELGLVTGDEVFEAETAGKRYARLGKILERIFVGLCNLLIDSLLQLEFKFNRSIAMRGFAPRHADEFLVGGIYGQVKSRGNGDHCTADGLASELGAGEVSLVDGVGEHSAQIVQASFPFNLHKYSLRIGSNKG